MQQKIPNPDEICKMSVAGSDFQDWKSVRVEHHWAEAWAFVRFTAVERQPNPQQFVPGQDCNITLGGEAALTGVITVRQVAYDANSHQVQLQGKSKSWYPSKSSIIKPTPTKFDGMTFQDIASQVCKPFGIQPTYKGDISSKPFKKLRVEPGENVWMFLERIARMRRIVCGSDQKGNFQFIGKGGAGQGGSTTLEEGKNILRMQCIFSVENTQSEYIMNSQSAGTDGHSGPPIAQQKSSMKGTAKAYSPLKTPNEHNVWDEDEVQLRTQHEQFWHEGDVLQAVVTLQGWKTNSPQGGSLWRVGDNVHIKSPMCPLDVELGILSAIFTQDNDTGTLTTLICVPPFLLGGESEFNMSQSGAPQDPSSYANDQAIQPSQ